MGYIVLTVCALAILFGIASILSADFRDNGALIIGTILGALGSIIGVIVGTEAARRYTNKDGGPDA